MSVVYVFEATIVKYTRDRIVIYPPKKYQEKLRRYRGRKVKVQVVIEPE